MWRKHQNDFETLEMMRGQYFNVQPHSPETHDWEHDFRPPPQGTVWAKPVAAIRAQSPEVAKIAESARTAVATHLRQAQPLSQGRRPGTQLVIARWSHRAAAILALTVALAGAISTFSWLARTELSELTQVPSEQPATVNVRRADAPGASLAAVLGEVRPGAVVLLHAGNYQAPARLETPIVLRAKGGAARIGSNSG